MAINGSCNAGVGASFFETAWPPGGVAPYHRFACKFVKDTRFIIYKQPWHYDGWCNLGFDISIMVVKSELHFGLTT